MVGFGDLQMHIENFRNFSASDTTRCILTIKIYGETIRCDSHFIFRSIIIPIQLVTRKKTVQIASKYSILIIYSLNSCFLVYSFLNNRALQQIYAPFQNFYHLFKNVKLI